MTFKRTMCALLAASMLATGAVAAQSTASAATVSSESSAASITAETSAASYGLADNIQDGVILHCFDWTYKQIMEELPNIAEAGFTAVQTSPAQPDGTGVWYWLYQPKGFYLSSNGLGTKADLEALCTEADKYGVKVVVDVVANHLAGNHSDIQDDLKDAQYWHTYGEVSSWHDRYQVTYGEIGMPDLATENPYVQQVVLGYANELKSVGVDGIRWDAAKHIGLPSEGDNFWKVVTNTGLYNYGEILVGPDDRESGNEGLMKEYTDYMSVTDSQYGSTVRNAFAGGNAPGAYGNWVARGLTSDKVVYWGESHDTWANAYEGDYSWNKSQNVIDRAYAAVASRNMATALYFSRPFSNPEKKENTKIGEKGSTHFTSAEVAAVNHFHNAMIGKADYYTSSNGCAVITRQGGGAVIVKGSGSGQVSVDNAGGYVPAGTYKDEVTGNEFTVTASTISGTIGESGIAVIYDADNVVKGGTITATPDGTTFTTDTLDITLGLKNATNGTYSTSEGDSGSFADGTKLTIGAKTNAKGTSVKITVTLKATNEDGSELSRVVTYTKADPSLKTRLYFDNSSYNWSEVYAYVYTIAGASNAKWPGEKMTLDPATGYYVIDVEDYKNGFAMFSDGSDSADKRYPADGAPGLEIGGSSKLFGANHSWTDYTAPSTDIDTDTNTDTDTATDTDTSTDTDSDIPVIMVLSGDANQDGKVSLRDASLVLKYSVNLVTLTGDGLLAADVNDDGRPDAQDVVLIQRYDIGINSYSIGQIVEK